MTNFEEEVKRPDNTGIEPFSKRDVDFSKLAAKFTRGAQTLKKWREYAGYLGKKLDTVNHNLYLETEQSAAYHAEIVEQKRENQRLKAENKAIKVLMDNAKPQQALPVVPECVAGAIESIPDHYSAFEAIDLIKSKVETLPEENKDWLQVYNWLSEGIENQDTFALAFITGKYEVEKPQLFYLKNKITGYYLYHAECHSFGELLDFDIGSQFTEREINSMETGSYEQIKVESD
jgi:Protein of unknown function (DUF1642).